MNWTAFTIGAIVAIAAYALGHYTGENRGRALGWLERNQYLALSFTTKPLANNALRLRAARITSGRQS